MSVRPIFEEPEYQMDLRVRERNLKEGVIQAAQVQEFLDALPDLEKKCEWVTLPEIESPDGMADVGTRKQGESEDAQEELLTEEL